MPAEQPLFPMGPPMLSTPRPEGVLELSWLQWTILIGSVSVFAVVVGLIVVRIVRQRRQPLLHSADERLLRERGASAELTEAWASSAASVRWAGSARPTTAPSAAA